MISQQEKLFNKFMMLKQDVQHLSSIVQSEEGFVTEDELSEFNEQVNATINSMNSLKLDVLEFYNKR